MSELWQNSILAKKIIKENHTVHLIVILFILLSIFVIKNPALIDWDEGAFSLQGQWLATTGSQGKPFNFQSPPLYQILIAILFKLFGINAVILPLLSAISSVITIYLIFYLDKTLYPEQEGIYTVILFVSTEFFLFFSKSGLSDATFLCFFTASLLFFIKGMRDNKTHYFFLTGLFTALALYTKYSAFILPVIFLTTGLLHRKAINRKWFVLSILVPILLYLPYIYLFIEFVRIPEISRRHVSILGLNHIKFLFYILTFAPMPFFLSITYTIFNIKKIREWYIFIFLAVYFFFLGLYYPYFRLAYPLIPLLSIIAARFIKQTGKYKTYILVISTLISLMLSIKTLTYKSDIPARIGKVVDHYVKEENIKYIYTVAPPNINFYVNGTIVVPANHPWLNIGKNFPVFMKGKKIIYPDKNELLIEGKTLLVHSTIFDSLKQQNPSLYKSGILLVNIEFVDAPVYYKDSYNPLRDVKQIYQIYLFDNSILGDNINDLWALGFNRQVTVIYNK